VLDWIEFDLHPHGWGKGDQTGLQQLRISSDSLSEVSHVAVGRPLASLLAALLFDSIPLLIHQSRAIREQLYRPSFI